MRLHNLGCHLRTMTISFTDLFMFQVANTENSINLFSQAQTHTCIHKQRRKYCFMLNHTHRDTHSRTSSCIMNTNKQSAAGTHVHAPAHTQTHTYTSHSMSFTSWRLQQAHNGCLVTLYSLSNSLLSASAKLHCSLSTFFSALVHFRQDTRFTAYHGTDCYKISNSISYPNVLNWRRIQGSDAGLGEKRSICFFISFHCFFYNHTLCLDFRPHLFTFFFDYLLNHFPFSLL